ncbi:hypothetical protein SAMN06297387_13617 [Streptomyces zhaozhouensis]|uniref:Uncharacterized protein n=1 Tax=Streptomyces zhaozhouensis TaxID=1300267 RepID=A0A286EAI2_9ACTN|nr:hypothetical protein [Streptomyces zhaozhouensis]SOD67844.1 hypothetical protein SAMN06297387_13617 [Streptomyces zhaozhouensis]
MPPGGNSSHECLGLSFRLGATGKVEVTERAIIVEGLDEPPRYHLQHTHGYQCHDRAKPHHHRRHGRADIGWPTPSRDGTP